MGIIYKKEIYMKTLFLFLVLVASTFAQLNITKYLTDTDSILNFSSQHQWIIITVVDSATADTVLFEMPSIGSTWITIAVQDLTAAASATYVTSIIPGTGLNGKKYKVPIEWCKGGRLRLTDVNTPNVKVKVEGLP